MTQTSKANVMVVDDQPANLKLLEDMLKNQGYAIRSFPRGQLALAAAAQSPPDLILLDINMPQMNGFEVCERLKSDRRLAEIPVIFLSALTESEDKIKAFRAGGVDYVTKPFQVAEVLARVETHVQLRRLQQTLERHSDHLEAKVRARTTDLVDANARLKLLAEALKAAPNAIVITDATGSLVWTNPAFSALSGYSAEEVIGKNRRLLNSGKQDENFYRQMWTTILSGKVWQGEIVNRRKDGSDSTEEMIIAPVSLAPSYITHFVTINQDISQRKRSEEELRRAEEKYRAIFEDAVVGIFRIAPEGRLLDVNRAFARMHGYDSAAELLAEASTLPHQIFIDVVQMDTWAPVLGSEGVVCGAEVKIARRGGAHTWGLVNLRAVRNSDSEVVFYEGTIEDITDRKIAQQEVHFLAYYDVLTELPNRALLRARLDKALAEARRRTDKVALLFLDLDRFKNINDSLGHSFGDLFLQQVAGRLKSATREQDTVARVGGDEFVIVLTSANDVEDIATAAERVIKSVTDEFVIQGQALKITCSLGISIFPEHGNDSETLIKNADAAMYSAKENGCDNFRFFTDDINARIVERLTLENGLRLALEREEFFLVYQPQVSIATGEVTGLEALLRWQHPQLGLVSPDKFVRITENTGLIVGIGEWVLRTACRQAKQWQNDGLLTVPIAVNVSSVQFRQDGFPNLIRNVLLETGLAPHLLELELTETLLLSNADMMFGVLHELKAMGLKLAIDDFGTGYSSLSYLRQFPVDKLKIDRSFIRDIAINPDDAAITGAIIGMARDLNLDVIAEGVENEAQLSFLRAHKCGEFQGYYYSQPLTVDQLDEKLRKPPAALGSRPACSLVVPG
ncbi:MAG: EAL domain-containing protein [Candidatus Korobacteraceae bacterium]|jgi:diguanylate cyclase (GGDEF)-like protein/PAS domain S-box-containing protein